MTTRSTWLVAFLTFAAAVAAHAGDWPNFRGPNRDGHATDKGINRDWTAQPPPVLWQAPLSDDGYGGPAVANGRVFLVDHEGGNDIVRALDLRTGSNVWTYSYAEAGGANYGFTRATPAIDQGRVYTTSRSGLVNCLDEKTGQVVWSKNLKTEFDGHVPQWGVAVSPVIDGPNLIVLPGGKNASVATLNKVTGALVWKGGGSAKQGYATPVVATLNGKKQYIVFTAREVSGIDAATGGLLWSVDWTTSYDVNAATPLVLGNAVFITSGYGHGGALINVTSKGAAIAWETKELVAHFNSPVADSGHIYGIGDPGNLVCLEVATGKPLWKQAGFEKGGLVAVDGLLIAADGKSGHLALIERSPAGYKELGRIQPLSGQAWTAPVVAAGRLLVRNKQTLACLDLMPPRR